MILYDQLVGNKTADGTWSFISGPGGAPAAPSAFDDDVDFSSADDGVYVYRYQVTSGSCTSLSTVTVTVGTANAAANDECETATNITAHFSLSTTTLPTGTTTFNSAEIWTQGCEKDIATASDDEPWTTAVVGDVWFRVPLPTLSPAADYNIGITVNSSLFSNGLSQPMLALYTGDCDGLTLLDQSEGTGSNVSLVANITGSPTRLYIRVGAKSTNEGLFDITLTT
jgi:hypothetical protein